MRAQFQEKSLVRLHTGTYVSGTEGACCSWRLPAGTVTACALCVPWPARRRRQWQWQHQHGGGRKSTQAGPGSTFTHLYQVSTLAANEPCA